MRGVVQIQLVCRLSTGIKYARCSLPGSCLKGYISNIRRLVLYKNRKPFTSVVDTKGTTNGALVDSLFDSLKQTNSEKVDVSDLLELIYRSGITANDPRINKFMKNLKKLTGLNSSPALKHQLKAVYLDRESFRNVTQENVNLLTRIVSNDLCIPDLERFSKLIEEVFDSISQNNNGDLANYIPELASVDPTLWGVSICTVDGQRINFGDSAVRFTMQSTSKPFTYAMALTELGSEFVHQHVGYEPSGVTFNYIGLDYKNRPHNPLINAGAMVVCSLLQPNLTPSERFKYVENIFSKIAGNQRLGFSNAVFLSERATADRNFALAYYLRENKCFPAGANLNELVDFYLQTCSIEANCEEVAVMAATLANGGVNPLTEQRVVNPFACRDTLSVMHSCGMYDYSGQFAFRVGLPSKSGVSGVIFVVIPDLMGLALYSPLIDRHGNSVRGVYFCQELVRHCLFHLYESHLHRGSKIDPRQSQKTYRIDPTASLLFAAQSNDLGSLRGFYLSGVDLTAADYADRTGLHLAATSGALDAVKFLVEVGRVDPNSVDKWGHTPLEDAKQFNQLAVVDYLETVQNKSGRIS